MKMAKPTPEDVAAADALFTILDEISSGQYPGSSSSEDTPSFFDENDPKHLRAFYDAVKGTLDRAPGYPMRVIGGMCHVILYDKNQIVDPDSDMIELHPRLVKALAAATENPPTLNAEPDKAQVIG